MDPHILSAWYRAVAAKNNPGATPVTPVVLSEPDCTRCTWVYSVKEQGFALKYISQACRHWNSISHTKG